MQPEWVDDPLDPVAQLGEPKAEYVMGRRRIFRHLVAAPLLIVIGAAIMGVPILAGFRHGGHWHVVTIGLVLVGMGVRLVVAAYRNRGLRVLVYAEGLVRVRGDDEQAILWEDIDVVWKKKYSFGWERAVNGGLVLSLERKKSGPVQLDDALPRLEELADTISQKTLPHLLAAARRGYAAGEALAFGKLVVSRRGLTGNEETLPWPEVQEVECDDNTIAIHKKGKWTKWFQAKAGDVPNYHVLRALLEQLLAERRTPRGEEARE